MYIWSIEECGGHSSLGEPGAGQPACHLDSVQGGSGSRPTATARPYDMFHWRRRQCYVTETRCSGRSTEQQPWQDVCKVIEASQTDA